MSRRLNNLIKATIKKLSLLVLTIVLLSLQNFAQEKTANETTRVNRLIALCKLWGKVKYFHPSLAYRTDIDWDAALIATIPKVREAKTSTEYEAALQSLLNVLGDSSTRIVKNEPFTAEDDKRQFQYSLAEDDILIITVGNYFDLFSSTNQEKLGTLTAEVPKAKAIVFDLRSALPVGDYGKFSLTSSFSQIERLISSAPFTTAGGRSRIYRGYESNSPFASGQYKSGFYLQNGKRIIPSANAKDIPSVFLLNTHSGLLESTLPLQAAGKALIVFDGNVKDYSNVKTEVLDLGEALSAQIRLVEPILEDGTSGDLQPDVVVPATEKDSDAALETALGLVRNFKPSTIARKKLLSVAVSMPDKSYPQIKYPSLEYRLLAAFRIWNVIHHFFPYKHLMESDWESVLREFMPKFERAKDALEYSLTVAEMISHIQDSHAYVSGSVINEHFGTFYPPIRVRLIENTPVVTHFFNETASKSAGVEIGDIVLKVDGEDAKVRLERYAKYISSSTPQNNADKASLAFMNGKDSSVVTLTLRDRNNKIKVVKLARKFEDFTTLYHRERSGEIIKLLPGNIGYADLDRLTPEMIDEMLEKVKNTHAIVFDMRGYPNDVYLTLPQRLTEKQNVTAALIETPLFGQIFIADSSESHFQNVFPAQPGKWIYKGKTVMLIDGRTISQAEHTGLFLRAANGTKFIGSPTAGANGEITTFSIPGGIGTAFSGQSVKFPDGKQLQRIGLVPDVQIKPTIKGIREGRDEVLEKAVDYLKLTKVSKSPI